MTTIKYKLTESGLDVFNKKTQEGRELLDYMRLSLPTTDKDRINQILTVAKELSRFSNDINGIPNSIVMVTVPTLKVKIKSLEIA